jgi:hypothetical protein
MKLAGMVGRPMIGLEQAGDFSPMKDNSMNKTNSLQICHI